jgi:hypothetical protein
MDAITAGDEPAVFKSKPTVVPVVFAVVDEIFPAPVVKVNEDPLNTRVKSAGKVTPAIVPFRLPEPDMTS